MELIKVASRRTFLSEVIYNLMNLSLAIGVFVLVSVFGFWHLVALLILLSKWRVFAVRPRFWFAHLQSNLVDTIVGLSAVAFLWLASSSVMTQVVITLLFAAWLVILKPRSKRRYMVWQAGIAQFAGLSAVASFSYVLPSSIVVLLCAVIGYASARHVLHTYDENATELISLTYGFIIAELAWLYYHWMTAYTVVASIFIPQLAIVTLLIGFAGYTVYDIYAQKGKLNIDDIRWPVAFMTGVLFVLFSAFTQWNIVQ